MTSVLVGASSVAQLEKNMRCIDAQPFSDAEI
jgi:aryl-alcohol dehydrogenase-like predicted oxidoreductase